MVPVVCGPNLIDLLLQKGTVRFSSDGEHYTMDWALNLITHGESG